MMKHIILCAAALLAAFSTLIPAEAKEKDPESQHVIVTLKSGEKVDGYIRRGWHAESSVFKTENFSFKITKTPDDKEPIEYTADDVESIEYTEVTEDNPDGIRWESHPLAKPNFIGGKSGLPQARTWREDNWSPTLEFVFTATPTALSTPTPW